MADDLTALAQFMYGDLSTPQGFWYNHSLREVKGLNHAQLYWIPGPTSLCILWHVGHIAHRERLHIGVFLQGLPQQKVLPYEFDVFGAEWASAEAIQASIPSVESVFTWAQEVRQESQRYIASLGPEDFWQVPPHSAEGLSAARWLFITASHTSLHIGRIQLLRALIEGSPERAC